MVEKKLSNLEISPEDLGNNENFTSCILRTTELVAKTSQKKKKEHLANALVNSINIDFEEATMMIFLDLIGKYTDLHITILKYYQNPQKFEAVKNSNLYMGAPISLFFETYHESKSQESLIKLIINDLYSDGLLTSNTMYTLMTLDGAKSKRTTELGDNFLDFFNVEVIKTRKLGSIRKKLWIK